MSIVPRITPTDDLFEEDIGTNRMLKEERVQMRGSSLRKSLKTQSVIMSVYEEKPKFWTATNHGHQMQCAKVTAASALDKGSDFWNRLPEMQKLEVEDGQPGPMKALVKRFCEMPKLEHLSVMWTEMKKVPSSCFKLSLKTLVLQHDNLRSIKGVELLSTLEELDTSSNRIRSLPKNLYNLQNLRVLNVCGNKLKQLPECIGQLQNLEAFNCASNRLTSLPDALTNLAQIVDIDISSNHLERLPADFGKLTKLTDLRASGNQLSSLPESFAQLRNLTSLLLGNNRLLFIPMELGALERLENLNLRHNHISSVDCALTSVKTLILDSNRLSSVSEGICRSVNVEVLSLENNVIRTFTGDICELTKLRSLQLSGNPLSDIPKKLLEDRHVKLRLLRTKYDKKSDPEVEENHDHDQSENTAKELPSSPEQLDESKTGQASQGAKESDETTSATSDQQNQSNFASNQPTIDTPNQSHISSGNLDQPNCPAANEPVQPTEQHASNMSELAGNPEPAVSKL